MYIGLYNMCWSGWECLDGRSSRCLRYHLLLKTSSVSSVPWHGMRLHKTVESDSNACFLVSRCLTCQSSNQQEGGDREGEGGKTGIDLSFSWPAKKIDRLIVDDLTYHLIAKFARSSFISFGRTTSWIKKMNHCYLDYRRSRFFQLFLWSAELSDKFGKKTSPVCRNDSVGNSLISQRGSQHVLVSRSWLIRDTCNLKLRLHFGGVHARSLRTCTFWPRSSQRINLPDCACKRFHELGPKKREQIEQDMQRRLALGAFMASKAMEGAAAGRHSLLFLRWVGMLLPPSKPMVAEISAKSQAGVDLDVDGNDDVGITSVPYRLKAITRRRLGWNTTKFAQWYHQSFGHWIRSPEH